MESSEEKKWCRSWLLEFFPKHQVAQISNKKLLQVFKVWVSCATGFTVCQYWLDCFHLQVNAKLAPIKMLLKIIVKYWDGVVFVDFPLPEL